MDCRYVEKHIVALVESALPREERERFEEHISRCGKCRALTDFISGVMAETEPAGEVEFSTDFWPRLNRRIEEYEQSRAGWLSRRPLLRPVAVAACLLFGTWAGIQLGSVYAEHISPPEDSNLPLVAVLDGVAPGSLAELLVSQMIDGGSRP
jgi:anti-sigma factor RsiW